MKALGKTIEMIVHAVARLWSRASTGFNEIGVRLTSDRGDVPGWVLVTVMTAGLVTGLWMVADDQLTSLLSKAINSVSN